jgi:hypothetical protein
MPLERVRCRLTEIFAGEAVGPGLHIEVDKAAAVAALRYSCRRWTAL